MKKLGASAKKNGNFETSEDMESNDFIGNRAQRRKLAKTKESVSKNNIKKGFGK